ncbi:hypothetical protein ACU4GD_09385 [Cupriavidus basilensis]
MRERITGIADPGSFREVGGLSGSGRYDSNGRLVDLVPSNLVMGRARIGGRPVVLVGTTSPCAAAPTMAQWGTS